MKNDMKYSKLMKYGIVIAIGITAVMSLWLMTYGLYVTEENAEPNEFFDGGMFVDYISVGPNEPNRFIIENKAPESSVTLYTAMPIEHRVDLFCDIEGDVLEVSYDEETRTLTSDRTAEDTLRLIYYGFDMMSEGFCLRKPDDYNEPINVVFAEPNEPNEKDEVKE